MDGDDRVRDPASQRALDAVTDAVGFRNTHAARNYQVKFDKRDAAGAPGAKVVPLGKRGLLGSSLHLPRPKSASALSPVHIR